MTAEDYLKLMIGDLAFQNASLRFQIDILQQELKKYTSKSMDGANIVEKKV